MVYCYRRGNPNAGAPWALFADGDEELGAFAQMLGHPHAEPIAARRVGLEEHALTFYPLDADAGAAAILAGAQEIDTTAVLIEVLRRRRARPRPERGIGVET